MSDRITYKLFRYSSSEHSTAGLIMATTVDSTFKFGVLRFQDEDGRLFRCFSLEDEFRENKSPGKTRIPAGTYEIKIRLGSPKFAHYDEKFAPWHHGMLWLKDVPGFTWIYLHPGNTDHDTAGCILVGDEAISNLPRVGRGEVRASVAAYKALYQEITNLMEMGKRVFLEIVDVA